MEKNDSAPFFQHRDALQPKANWLPAPIDFEILTNFINPDDPFPVVAYITEEPRLPRLPVDLELSSGLRLAEITYACWIEYKAHGRNDRSHTIQGKSGSLDFFVDFGNYIMGGVAWLKVIAVVMDRAGRFSVIQNTFFSNILGTNPSKENIRKHLATIELQVTAYRESRFRQFDRDGLPLFGPPNGYGIMQIDNPPATSEQIWNWKANIAAGTRLYSQKHRDAETYPSRVRAQGVPNATDFTSSQLKFETYQRYNGGGYWKWDATANTWAKSPPNNYADESVSIEQKVSSGEFPSGWLIEEKSTVV